MSEIEKTVEIKNYGSVTLKKMTFRDQSILRGKIMQVDILNGKEEIKVNSENFFFWQAVLGIKALPEKPNFDKLSLDERENIIGNLPAEIGQSIWNESIQFNQTDIEDLKKK